MSDAALSPIELAQRLALLLALAVFFGLAFEDVYKREARSVPGGIRTFPLLALAGALLYLVEPRHALAFAVGLVALAAWLYAFLWLETPPDGKTLVIPAANLLAYALGPVALSQPPFVAIGATVAAVLLTGWREQMHGFVQRIPQEEIVTAGKFLILAGIILPLLPDTKLIAAAPVTPFRVWLAVVAISGLSYATYLIQRYCPVQGGVMLPALLGGAYSSTVTTVVLAKRQREAAGPRPELSAGIVAATAMMYPRLGIVIAVFSPRLGLALLPALGVLFLASAALAWREWRRIVQGEAAELSIPTVNPLQLTTALVFASTLSRGLARDGLGRGRLRPDRDIRVGGNRRGERHRSLRADAGARECCRARRARDGGGGADRRLGQQCRQGRVRRRDSAGASRRGRRCCSCFWRSSVLSAPHST